MPITHFKIADNFDVASLQVALKRQPWLFGQQNFRKAAYEHTDMTDIWVRYNDISAYTAQDDFEFINAEHDSVWYPAYYMLPQLRPIISKLMTLVDGERLGGVLITKLPPGGSIKAHVDTGWHASYYDKYYIPIQNEDGAVFSFPDGDIKPKLGEGYWFENSIPHSVVNNSDSDRIALIVCIRSDSTRGAYRPQPVPELHERKLHFSNNVCVMQMKLPAGCKAESHVHTYDHLSYLVSGEVLIHTPGNPVLRRIAPCAIEIKANLAHEITAIKDTVWLCIHGTEETDPAHIDEVLIKRADTSPISTYK